MLGNSVISPFPSFLFSEKSLLGLTWDLCCLHAPYHSFIRVMIIGIIGQGHHGAILSAYEVIMTDSDTGQTSDTYESYYIASPSFTSYIS